MRRLLFISVFILLVTDLPWSHSFHDDLQMKSSDVKSESPWDVYISTYSGNNLMHWFSMINSLLLVFLLSALVAVVVMRALYKDINSYNQLLEIQVEETGWKLIRAEVFRPPLHAGMLCVCVAYGVQVFGTVLFTIALALMGLLSPSNERRLTTAMFLLWMFMGLFGGYFSARLYKMFDGEQWWKIASKTAFGFPFTLYGTFNMSNPRIWMLLWWVLSVPLVFLGSYLGFKQQTIEDPVTTNVITRQIPLRAGYNSKMVFSVLIGGLVQLAPVIIEFFFIWTCILKHEVYYSFGFLLISFVGLLVTCCEIAILLCYFQLQDEDYHWWWRPYWTAASSTLYMSACSGLIYFFTKLDVEHKSASFPYIWCAYLGPFAVFAFFGTIGFYACFLFVRKIYSSLEFD